MKVFLKVFLWVLVFLAVSNLAIIYLFHQDIAEYINKDIVKASLEDSGISIKEKPVIKVTLGNVSYDGKGTFDVLDGVTAFDCDGVTDITDKITAMFVTDNKIGSKTIKYSVVGSNGNVGTNERKLTLLNYTTPTIQIVDNVEIKATDLDNLVSVMKNNNSIKAYDGFGNDITDKISYNYEVSDASLNKYKITFTVNTFFADVKSQTIFKIINGAIDGPSLILRNKSIVLKVGDIFNPIEYIQLASDTKDGNLIESVKISGGVDTKKKGQYVVTYSVTNSQGISVTAKLAVYVN